MPTPSFDEAFEQVKQLVATFQENEKYYLSPKYDEATARKDFIDKFWMALGWDVNHDTQKNPYEQEVKVEHSGKGSERRRRADYAFLASNFRDLRFYVEAKKPSIELENRDHYFQAIRYGWNGQTPLAILTDFEQFHILDCRYKPDLATALYRILEKYHFTDYADPDKFAKIYYLFSREAAHSGSIEKYAANLPKPTGKARQKSLFPTGGYQQVDESFLQKLDEYREELARSFKNKNAQLGSEELTEVTQRTLDRLVFIRFLEDKLIETDPIVENFGNKGSVWQDFVTASARLDKIYNGIIFKKHEILDSLDFKVDEKVFDSICEEISHANSPYDFNSIPIHILGSIYERFLGKTIVATDKRATVVEKPEVRKAGGVYYTPEYIVRYIVENTVGKLIAGKTPDEIREMRFADIACGSGSFLLGVYDVLLRYYTAYYNANKTRRKEGLKAGCREDSDGTLHLSLLQRRDILLNNLYGVDIDTQAVEVAQLSLYLKMLEDETTSSAKAIQLELRQALLPSLNKNIICGNSLIGWDILGGMLFEAREERKLNPMDFADAFPQIMKSGGFDAIVGNPPYGMVNDERRKDYFERYFKTTEGRFDNYELFIEQALKLCRTNGLLGYIVPSPLLSNLYTKKLRRHLLDNCFIREITNFGLEVFADPTIHTCIIILSKEKGMPQLVKIRKQVCAIDELTQKYDYEISQAILGKNDNFTFDVFIDPIASKIIEKMQSKGRQLGEICYIRQCIKTGDDEKYVQVSAERPTAQWRPSLRGKSIGKYVTTEKNLWLHYGSWLARNWKNISFYETPKIAIRETGNRIIATIDLEGRYFLSSLYSVYPISDKESMSLFYLLGSINSSLATYFVKVIALDLTKGAFAKFRTNQLARLPIRAINFSDKADKARHDQMVQLVEQMMEAKKLLAKATTDRDKTFYENKCAAFDRQIDRLVYELYELTDEEIKIVEGES